MFQVKFGGFCTTPGSTNITENRALGLRMASEYMKRGTDARSKATILRAYLTTSCAGSFNQLFSGDGYTYTGTGRS
jgi:hypothetical protein